MGCNDVAMALAGLSTGVRPSVRRWVKGDQIDSSRASLGSTVDVNFGSLSAKVGGRFAHLRGIYFDCKARITTVDDNVAIPAYNLRSIFAALQLKDSAGHMYWPGTLDGTDILDDAFFRNWATQDFPYLHTGTEAGLPTTHPISPTIVKDYGVGADTQVGTADYPCGLYAPLATLARNVSPLQGLIPISTLQVQDGGGALSFVIGPIKGDTTGATLVNLIRPDGQVGVDVWFDVVYMDDVIIDAPWQLRSYTRGETSSQLDDSNRITEYAVVRFKPWDSPAGGQFSGQLAANNIGTTTITVAESIEVAAYTLTQMKTRQMLMYGSEPLGAMVRANAKQDLPLFAPDEAALAIILLPYRPRESAPSGPITYDFSGGSGANIRFLHRTVSCQTRERAEIILNSAKCRPCAVFGTDSMGTLTPGCTATAPLVAKP